MIRLSSSAMKHCRDRAFNVLSKALGHPNRNRKFARYYVESNCVVDVDDHTSPSYPAHDGSPNRRYYLTTDGTVELVKFTKFKEAKGKGWLPLYTREPAQHSNCRPVPNDSEGIHGVWVPFTIYLDANEIDAKVLVDIIEQSVQGNNVSSNDDADVGSRGSAEQRELAALQLQLSRMKKGR